MSLINQVLSDLERRGANSPLVDMPIRAVPIQNKIKIGIYIALGLIVIAGVFTAWRVMQKSQMKPNTPVVASTSIPGVVTPPSEVLPSQPEMLLAAAVEQVKVIPVDEDFFRLSSELSSIPQENRLEDKPLPVKERQLVVNETPPKANTKNAHPGSNKVSPHTAPSMSKELKMVSLTQQAENEFRKANLLAQQRRLKEAADGFQAALALDPGHVMAREYLVAVLLESKLNKEAEKVLQEGLINNPKEIHFAMLLARILVERNALPQALETLEKTLEYADQQADYNAFFAAILQRQSRHKEAIMHYEIALNIMPSSGLWFMGLGISLQALDRKEDANLAYLRAIETQSLSPELQAYVMQRIKDLKSK